MTAYVKIVGGEVVEKECAPKNGFKSAPDNVTCGMLTDDDGKTFRNPPPPEPTVDDFHDALYDHINSFARARGWDSRVTYMQRATFRGRYQQEAAKYWDFVEACEEFGLSWLAAWGSGEKPAPESVQAFRDALPPFNP